MPTYNDTDEFFRDQFPEAETMETRKVRYEREMKKQERTIYRLQGAFWCCVSLAALMILGNYIVSVISQ